MRADGAGTLKHSRSFSHPAARHSGQKESTAPRQGGTRQSRGAAPHTKKASKRQFTSPHCSCTGRGLAHRLQPARQLKARVPPAGALGQWAGSSTWLGSQPTSSAASPSASCAPWRPTTAAAARAANRPAVCMSWPCSMANRMPAAYASPARARGGGMCVGAMRVRGVYVCLCVCAFVHIRVHARKKQQAARWCTRLGIPSVPEWLRAHASTLGPVPTPTLFQLYLLQVRLALPPSREELGRRQPLLVPIQAFHPTPHTPHLRRTRPRARPRGAGPGSTPGPARPRSCPVSRPWPPTRKGEKKDRRDAT